MKETKDNGTKSAAKWKEILVGGASGITLGAVGTLFASSIPQNAAAETADTENETPEDETATAQIATHVTDSMSFSDAFNAARAEVGAGGIFEWHGNIYSTYTAEEWNNMDDDSRNEFAESVQGNVASHEHVAASHNHSTHSTHSSHTESVANTNISNGTSTNNNQNPGKEDENSPEVEIIGVEHANIDGEHDSIIGTANVNGQTVYFIDVDGQDDEFELMAADVNGNQQIDEGEIVDISDHHYSVSHFEQQANQVSHNNQSEDSVQYYANNEDLPDYVNDADPGALA